MKELIYKLESMNKGAKAHTINKVIFYLRSPLKNVAKENLENLVRKALAVSDWKEVEDAMKFWW